VRHPRTVNVLRRDLRRICDKLFPQRLKEKQLWGGQQVGIIVTWARLHSISAPIREKWQTETKA